MAFASPGHALVMFAYSLLSSDVVGWAAGSSAVGVVTHQRLLDVGKGLAECTAKVSQTLVWCLTSRQARVLPSVAREKFGTIEMSSSPAKNSIYMSDRNFRMLSEGCMMHNEQVRAT